MVLRWFQDHISRDWQLPLGNFGNIVCLRVDKSGSLWRTFFPFQDVWLNGQGEQLPVTAEGVNVR